MITRRDGETLLANAAYKASPATSPAAARSRSKSHSPAIRRRPSACFACCGRPSGAKRGAKNSRFVTPRPGRSARWLRLAVQPMPGLAQHLEAAGATLWTLDDISERTRSRGRGSPRPGGGACALRRHRRRPDDGMQRWPHRQHQWRARRHSASMPRKRREPRSLALGDVMANSGAALLKAELQRAEAASCASTSISCVRTASACPSRPSRASSGPGRRRDHAAGAAGRRARPLPRRWEPATMPPRRALQAAPFGIATARRATAACSAPMRPIARMFLEAARPAATTSSR